MREIVRVVTVSRWDATMNGAVLSFSRGKWWLIVQVLRQQLLLHCIFQLSTSRKNNLLFKIQNSACLSMELLPTNFIHYLLEWIVNSRIHIMDFSIWSLQRYCCPVSSTCDSQMCVQSFLNLCEWFMLSTSANLKSLNLILRLWCF